MSVIIKPTTITIQHILHITVNFLSILQKSLPHIISIPVLRQYRAEIRYIVNV